MTTLSNPRFLFNRRPMRTFDPLQQR